MGWSRCIGGFVLYLWLEGFAISEKLLKSTEKDPAIWRDLRYFWLFYPVFGGPTVIGILVGLNLYP